MSLGKSFNIKGKYKSKVSDATGWSDTFPGPADLSFNYRKLMDAAPNGLALNANAGFRVAIVGGGVTGIAAARELLRSGVVHVHIYEASDRLGGRHYTKYGEKDSVGYPLQYTTFEGGAMRFPPFLPEGETDPRNGKCLLSYYLNEFNYKTEGFPNPGSAFADTGIYYNRGHGSGDYETPTMSIWKKEDDLPPTEALQNVYNKWSSFAEKMLAVVSQSYSGGSELAWSDLWKEIVNNYWEKTFRDVVLDPVVEYDVSDPGNFGGAGMTEEEAALFYIIGAGDGSWGAFYNLAFLYAYRTFIHGYGSDLYLMQGAFDDEGAYIGGPFVGSSNLVDSGGSKISPPCYLGTSAFYEGMMFKPITIPVLGSGVEEIKEISMFDALDDSDLNFRIWQNCPVNSIDRDSASGTIMIRANGAMEIYDAVIVTVPTWQYEKDIKVTNFSPDTEWPFSLQTYLKRAHWEPACKVFVGLTEPYWENENVRIPQMISTDTFVHDAYGVVVHQGEEQKGGLLVSYTWWRDANKLVAYSDEELVELCVKELDLICRTCSNISESLLPFVDMENSWVIHWEKEKYIQGAARLYDQREWNDTQLPMAYNQMYSKNSNLYLAGESYHVDAGWTEPCLRQAIDSVLYMCVNNGIPLRVQDFNFETDYPRYDESFQPG